MKKLLSVLLVIMMVFTFAGCGGDDTGNEIDNPIKSIDEFETEFKAIVPDATREDAYFEMVGANAGYKMYDKDGNVLFEIYSYDKDSDAYKKAEADQKIYIESMDYSIEAKVTNGYAIVMDSTANNYSDVMALFDRLR